MNRLQKALYWATATCLVAVAGRQGWIDPSSALTLTLVLPILGWTTLNGRGCTPRRG